MKRIILMVAYNILLVPVMWFKLCYYARHVEKYTEEELNALTVAQIKAIAAERGYDLKETVKAKLIAEFLTQQG